MRHTPSLALAIPAVALILAACSSDSNSKKHGSGSDAGADAGADAGGTDAGDGGGAIAPLEWPHLGCDPLGDRCGFPFPSNVYTVPDDATVTKRRVAFEPEFFPKAVSGAQILPDPWSKSDGFSPGSAVLAYFDGATEAGLPLSNTIPSSLDADCPTVLLDAATGERVLHFSELDHSTADPTQRALLIHPAVRLKDGARYIVAIRKLQGASGPLEPSPAFAALRDDTESDDASVTARRALYRDIFAHLEKADVARSDLQLAWDFTTASRESNTAWLVHMRDEATALLGDAGPEYTIDSVDTDYEPAEVQFRINLHMHVPNYLTSNTPPESALVFGEDGLPKPNPDAPYYDVPVEVLIPVGSSAAAPAKLLAYGHGLLGERSQIEAGNFRTFISRYGYAIFGVDLIGLASDDALPIAGILNKGNLHEIDYMFARLHQGFLNSLLAMRLFSTSFAKDPTYGKYLDPESRYYYGISQGGIGGGVFMGVTTDVKHGVLEMMGQPYNLLLNRSSDFDPFFAVLRGAWPDARDQQIALGLVQMLWDRVEPDGYTPYIEKNMLPGTPSHSVLLRGAFGDHQVTNLGARVMARSVGAKHVDTGFGAVFGLEEATAPVASGSTYLEYSFGLPPDPVCNVPQDKCGDPHGKLRKVDEAMAQMNVFLTTGETRNTCNGGVCDLSAQSECTGGESNEGLCR